MIKHAYRKTYFLFPLLVFILFLVYISLSGNKKPDEEITIAVAKQPAFALMYVADKKGFFKDEGITVKFRKYILGRDALQDVVEEKADLATVFDIPTLNQINKGTDLAILTTLHNSSKNHVIASLKTSGIQKPSDLRGRRVAMTKGVSTEFFLYSFLTTEGIALSEVNTVSIEPDRLIESMENSTIDAAVLFNPYIYNLRKKYPEDKTTFFYSDAYTEMSVLTGKRLFIDQNQDKIRKVLRALLKAERFIKENKDQSIRLVDESLDNYDRAGVRSTWDIFDFSLTLNNKLLVMMEREARFFTNTGIYKADPPYLRKYILTDYLKEVKPDGVTIY